MSPSRRRALARCMAWHPAPRVRPRLAHPRAPSPFAPPVPRCAHHYARALPGRRDGDIAPYRHYTRVVRPRLAPPRRIARGGSPPRCVAWQVAHAESFAGASPCAPHSRAGRGVRSPHPRHSRGTAPSSPPAARSRAPPHPACAPGLPARAPTPRRRARPASFDKSRAAC